MGLMGYIKMDIKLCFKNTLNLVERLHVDSREAVGDSPLLNKESFWAKKRQLDHDLSPK